MGTLFTEEMLCDAAAREAGSRDFGDDLYLPPLRALMGAIEAEAQIEPQRVWRTGAQFIALLAVRARMTALLRAHPEIRDVPVRAPVFIVGMPRTGTTLLHNLLAGHPAHRAPRLWQLRSPVRPEGAGPEWEAAARNESARVLELLYSTIPEFAAIHPMSADWPDECSWLFRHDFCSMVYAYTYYVPSYVDWILGADMVPYYERYKLALQMLAWHTPDLRGGRLVLKDPCHLWHLDALLRVFPDARILHLHRTMTEALPSMASLCFALQHTESGRTDPRAMADYCLSAVERGLHPATWLRQTAPRGTFLDVRYTDLVADPLGSAARICEEIGSGAGPEAIAGMEAWLHDNRQHKAGRHAYTLEQFGFDRDAVLRRFRRYEEEFVVPR